MEPPEDNLTMDANLMNGTEQNAPCLRTAYKYSIPPLFVFCVISVIVNVKVVSCVYWIRRPLSPTLLISLSLAIADACTSFLHGAALFISSYLSCVHGVNAPGLIPLIIEIGRLSGQVVTVAHLFALSGNHYLGILKPLHYHHSMVSTGAVTLTIIVLWTCPVIFVTCYFILGYKYVNSFSYRLAFSSLFFVPLMVMCFFYVHILVRVRKQQRVWSQLSRNGSTRWKAVKTSSKSDEKQTQQQRQVEGNIRAIKTTLLILGSCVLGWMPAVLAYVIMCYDGCLISGEYLDGIRNSVLLYAFMWMKTFFLILKTLINPIIYTIRMTEIQEGTRRMYAALSSLFGKKTTLDIERKRNSIRYAPGYTDSSQVSKVAIMHSFKRSKSSIRHKNPVEYNNTLL